MGNSKTKSGAFYFSCCCCFFGRVPFWPQNGIPLSLLLLCESFLDSTNTLSWQHLGRPIRATSLRQLCGYTWRKKKERKKEKQQTQLGRFVLMKRTSGSTWQFFILFYWSERLFLFLLFDLSISLRYYIGFMRPLSLPDLSPGRQNNVLSVSEIPLNIIHALLWHVV